MYLRTKETSLTKRKHIISIKQLWPLNIGRKYSVWLVSCLPRCQTYDASEGRATRVRRRPSARSHTRHLHAPFSGCVSETSFSLVCLKYGFLEILVLQLRIFITMVDTSHARMIFLWKRKTKVSWWCYPYFRCDRESNTDVRDRVHI